MKRAFIIITLSCLTLFILGNFVDAPNKKHKYSSAAYPNNNTLGVGDGLIIDGANSAAIGENLSIPLTARNSLAVGNFIQVNSTNSLGLGVNTILNASAQNSFAFGNANGPFQGVQVAGANNVAMGSNIVLDGENNVVFGSNIQLAQGSGTAYNGCFLFGDSGFGNTLSPDSDNQFMARASGGYKLITDANNFSIGAFLPSGASSWSAISDSTKKENFLQLEEEGVLQKIASFPKLGTWNYKGQDKRKFRHYGPMAQDFFAAFGNDDFGRVGCDTLIASADMMGINFSAIYALEKRTASQKKLIEKQQQEINKLKEQVAKLNSLEDKMNELEAFFKLENEQ